MTGKKGQRAAPGEAGAGPRTAGGQLSPSLVLVQGGAGIRKTVYRPHGVTAATRRPTRVSTATPEWVFSTLGRIRICNLLVRNQTLCPIELRGQVKHGGEAGI